MPDAVLEVQTETGGIVSKDVIRTLSLSGMTDVDILRRFTSLKPITLRQWRARDPAWRAAFQASRTKAITERNKQAVTKSVTLLQEEAQITKVVTESIEETHASTALKLVKASAKALSKFAENAPTPETWTDAKTAYSVQRLAAGIDREGGPVVTMNLWGSGGIAAQTDGNTFRDVGPTAPDAPQVAIEQPEA